MYWKDSVILGIAAAAFLSVIISIIINDKTPMEIYQIIFLSVVLLLIPSEKLYHWLMKATNKKKNLE